MSTFNSPIAFREQELFFDDIPNELLDPENCELDEINLEAFTSSEQELFKLAEQAMSTFHSIKDRVKTEKENRDRKEDEKNMLLRKIISTKHSLEEMSLKKNAFEIENSDIVSKDELSEMAQKMVLLEKEQELRQIDMKMKAKVFIGQMCFYKEYLDIYVDVPNLYDDYVLYFRKCRAEDSNKPKEWIRIKTDDFKKFVVIDIGSSGKMDDELLKQIKATDKNLRELVIETRELCLNIK